MVNKSASVAAQNETSEEQSLRISTQEDAQKEPTNQAVQRISSKATIEQIDLDVEVPAQVVDPQTKEKCSRRGPRTMPEQPKQSQKEIFRQFYGKLDQK